jgi:multisubunit Na+/H+ antiporter MnhB subunit
MRGFLRNLRALRGSTPMRRGLVDAAGAILVLAGISWYLMAAVAPDPSGELLRGLSEIGATLLIAYVLEISWIVRASRARPLQEREERLGTFVGVGAAALAGICLALALSERTAVHHWTWLDELGFGFVVGPLLMVAITVAMQPLLVHEWMDEDQGEASSA